MNWRARKFLNFLTDGAWYTLAPPGIGENTVSYCIDQGLVTTKKTKLKRKGPQQSYIIAFRLTRYGRSALKKALKGVL